MGIVILLWDGKAEGRKRHGRKVARWGGGGHKGADRESGKHMRIAWGKDGHSHAGGKAHKGGRKDSDDSGSTSSGDKGRTSHGKGRSSATRKRSVATEGTKTVLEILREDAKYAEFAKLVQGQSEVIRILSDNSRKLTLLVPSNMAVRNRGAFSDAARLLVILLYHIVEGTFAREELRDGSVRELRTQFTEDAGVFAKLPGGLPQVIALRDGLLTTGVQPDAKILSEEPVVASNGLIYQTDVMLVPPIMTPEGLEGTPYAGALEGLLDKVYRRVGLTLFLPVSGGPWPTGTGEQMTSRHAVEGRPIYWGDLWDGLQMTAIDGSTLLVKLKGDQFIIGGRRIIRANIPTMFGVVHLVEGPLKSLSASELRKATRGGKDIKRESGKATKGERYVPRDAPTDGKAVPDEGALAGNSPADDPAIEARKEAAKRKNDEKGSSPSSSASPSLLSSSSWGVGREHLMLLVMSILMGTANVFIS